MKKIFFLILLVFSWIINADGDCVWVDAKTLDPKFLHEIITQAHNSNCCHFLAGGHKIVLKGIVFFGQSNTEGGDHSGTLLSGAAEVNHSFTFYKPNDSSATNNGKFETQIFGRNNNWRNLSLVNCGPELSFAKRWQDAHADPIVIIKYSLGGSALVDKSIAYANGSWQIDANPAHGYCHYQIAVKNFVIPAIKMLQARGVYLDIVAMSWCQGGTDAQGSDFSGDATDNERHLTYQAELIRLINKFKADVGPYNVRGANIKPIITREASVTTDDRQWYTAIRTAHENVAAYYGVPYVNADSYEVVRPHFTLGGQSSHGTDVYTIFNTLL